MSSTNVLSNTQVQGQQFKTWFGNCEAGPQRRPVCYLEQTLRQDGHIIMRGVIGYAPGKPFPTVFFELPPGIDIAAGVSLKVDNKKPIRFNGRCTQQLCSAGFVLNAPMMRQFKKGRQSVVTYSPARGQPPISIPLSLMGITAGLNALR